MGMDWKTLIQKLIDMGMTQQQIAAHCGVSQSSISDLASGNAKKPRFDTGAAIVELAKRKEAA